MMVLILHGNVPPDASKDEQDVLVEVEAVNKALRSLKHDTTSMPLTFAMEREIARIKILNPDIIFNLVESIDGRGRFIQLAPMLFHHLDIPFTGAGLDAMFATSNKIIAKHTLKSSDIRTAKWITARSSSNETRSIKLPYIVKSVWEHASIGLSEESIFNDKQALVNRLSDLERSDPGNWFAEEFIEGREFNISMLEQDGRPVVLPIAEIVFKDFPQGKPRIVDYKAKWDESSPEYTNTVRNFDYTSEDDDLLENLKKISIRCWHVFGLSGYARVDFRVDRDLKPYVLEINANPCLSPDAGFFAACERNGMSYGQVIDLILKSADLS